MNADFTLLTRVIDEHLVSLGTQSLLDGDKVRDILLDVRSIVSSMANEALLESVTEEV